MIISIRVDERLIHGQVALVWTKEFSTTHVVVANDAAASNKVQQMTLQMATPTGIKVLIKSIDDSIKVFNNPRAKDTRLFVLTANIADALKIVQNCKVGSVDVANVGRITNPKPGENRIRLNPHLFVDEPEMDALKKLVDSGIEAYNQVLPSDHKTMISTLIKDVE